MSKPSSRSQLKEYCLRKLGKPVIEINVDDDQIEDLIDDTIQLYTERSYGGMEKMFLKYQLTQEDIDNGTGRNDTTLQSDANDSDDDRSLTFLEGRGYLTVPDHIISVEGIFKVSNTYTSSMFGFKYQFFLNDFYNFYSYDILNYYMVMTHLETLDFMFEGNKAIRFNKVQNRLFIDVDWGTMKVGDFIVIDCHRALDPNQFTKLYNEIWVKQYLTALIKMQWGQNLSKFEGIQMPGGVTFNGRQMYDDANQEIEKLYSLLITTYELPPLDMVG